MADPNLNNANVGTGGGPPPAGYDPYQALIAGLLLPADLARMMEAAFARLGCQMVRDAQSVKDFGQTPLPHYRVTVGSRVLIFLNVGASVTSNPYGQPTLIPIVFPFLTQASHLFIFSEVEALAFSTDALIGAWQSTKPGLSVEFVTEPQILGLMGEADDDKRAQTLKDLLSLHDVLALAAPQPLEQLLEDAYKQRNPQLLNGVSGLPDKLTTVKNDLDALVEWLGEVAGGPPAFNHKQYYWNLLKKLSLDPESYQFIYSALDGKSAWVYARGLLVYLEEKTYPNGTVPGYSKILGYLLYCLADEGGGGKRIVMLIFKYRLIDDPARLQALMDKYPN